MRLKLVPSDTSIDFLRHRRVASIFSFVLLLSAIGLFLSKGLNLGIDFRGGILIEARNSAGAADISGLRHNLESLSLGDISLQGFGADTDILVRVQRQEGDEAAQIAAIEAISSSLGETYDVRRTEFVGPTVGAELAEKGLLAVACALLAIMVYIWFRFEWQFSIAAILALAHDILSTIGLFALTNFEFNLATVAAILTIAGYSINDTVVVFDRIRERSRQGSDLSLSEQVDQAVSATLTRTLYTIGTTLLRLLALIFFGGSTLYWFAIALALGVVVGSWSSIALAPSLLTLWEQPREA